MDNLKIKKLVIVTTVPETIATILQGQPKWLSRYTEIICVTSSGVEFERARNMESVEFYAIEMLRGISPFHDLISIFKMWRLFRQLEPDAVHSYTPKAGMVSIIAGYLAAVPFRIHTFTGLIFPSSKGLKRKVLIFIDRLICLLATHIIPEGEGVKSDLVNHRITQKPLTVIGYGNIAGVDVEHYRPLSDCESNAHDPQRFTFCYIGRLNRDKGIQELVSAFVKLRNEPKLILVGKLDETAPISSETTNIIMENDRITCTGFLDDIRPILAGSSLLVLPSYREGFPNVLLQAGAMGLPVIASNINGCNEIIDDNFNGWLVSPRDVEDLRGKMEHVMSISQGELAVMGFNARARVVERYERSVYLNKLFEFYQEIAN